MDELVVVRDDPSGVRHLTLNRPDRLNALTVELGAALRVALDGCADDERVRAVVLTGAGRAFCAGHDLSDRDPRRTSDPPDLGGLLEEAYNPLIRRVRDLDRPVIAAVNGVAAGAGANLALACDIVLAGRSASFLQAFSRIGLVPDCGGTWLLPRLVREARAKGLALLAEPIDAATAAAWGLIWRVVDDEELATLSTALAARLAAGPTRAYALTKRAIHEAGATDLDVQLDRERDWQREAGRTADHGEGVAAFFDRRPPRFEGR
ncbi:MAG: 2-(1,2-epoxy-1,2-dihydrophenyl)acetyl-CoA isomerase PaaG [Pseudomonadota bacterium]